MEDYERIEKLEMEKIRNMQEIAKIYSKNNCKDCCGRGYVLYDMIDKANPENKYIQYCHCVQKRMKKFR